MKIEGFLPRSLSSAIDSLEQSPRQNAPFNQWLVGTVSQTNEQLLAADSALQQLASGQSNNLHQVMLTLEEAKLSFQFLEQIRNRLMTAYQDLLKEQI